MMHIAVTGGSGHTGRAVVDHLTAAGYSIHIVDKIPPHSAGIPYKLCDLEDAGQTIQALAGADAVVHLAAIPRPTFHPNSVVFRSNVLSMYNVLEAVVMLGIRKVVYASSISVTGYPFYQRFFEPQYVPIDEDHPLAPQDSYALSKYLGEEIAKAFVRRSGIDVISLRLAWIHTPDTFRTEIAPNHHDPIFGASNLWLYVDARDVSQACRLSLESHLEGHHAFYITAQDSFMETPSLDLVKLVYPHAEIRPGFGGRQSLISSSKAGESLGYIAQYTWEGYGG